MLVVVEGVPSLRRQSRTRSLPSPVLSEPLHRSLAPTKLVAGGRSLVRKVGKGDKSRPTEKKAHSPGLYNAEEMGEKSQRLENEPHKKFNFFLISVGQSGNKDVPILRAPSQDSYVHMCTQTHTTYAIPNTCLNMYKGMTVLTWPVSTW